MKIEIGPTGNLVKGSILDVSQSGLLRALQDYDKQLYIRWNPRSTQEWSRDEKFKVGTWEIRRKPNQKCAVYKGTHQGCDIYSLEYVEINLENHILDCTHLNYSILTRLKKMDTWADKRWIDNLEYEEDRRLEVAEDKLKAERSYNLKQNRTAIRELREAILSGENPNSISHFWGRKPARY